MSSSQGTFQPPPSSFAELQPATNLTPLMSAACVHGDDGAAMAGALAVAKATFARDGNFASKSLLLDLINYKDTTNTGPSGGYAAIHYAANHGNVAALRFLLDAGADPNLTKNNGCTALHTAIASAGWEDEFVQRGKTPRVPREDYIACMELLLEHPEFDLERNDGNSGISAAWMCVAKEYSGRDCLSDVLDMLLRKGLDPNGCNHNIPALHFALEHGHDACVISLVRHGANVSSRRNGMTAMEAAREYYGEGFAHMIKVTSAAASAVCDTAARLKALRSGDANNIANLASRAREVGENFTMTMKYGEAAEAFTEAYMYGPDHLSRNEYFLCMLNASQCLLQVARGDRAVEVARKLYAEHPAIPYASVVVAMALIHPCRLERTPKMLKEVIQLADEAIEKEASATTGLEWWSANGTSDVPTGKVVIGTATQCREMATSELAPRSPAIQYAQSAIDEFNKAQGSTEKAAHDIDMALKPELKHPNPAIMRALRGSIYMQYGVEILRANSICSSDRDEPIGGLGADVAPLKEKLSWKDAREKFETALNEFRFCASEVGAKNRYEQCMHKWNCALALHSLGRTEEASEYAITFVKLRSKMDLDNLASSDASQLPPGAASDRKQVPQLELSLSTFRMMTAQRVLESLSTDDESLAALTGQFSMTDVLDTGEKANLSSILDTAVDIRLMDKKHAQDVIERVSRNDAQQKAARVLWSQAIQDVEASIKAVGRLKRKASRSLVDFVDNALWHQEKKSKADYRFIKSLLEDALAWDNNTAIPSDLRKVMKMTNAEGDASKSKSKSKKKGANNKKKRKGKK